MPCCEFVESLAEFVSAEPELGRLEALDSHLFGCLCCAVYMDTYLLSIRLTRLTLRRETE